MIKKLYHDAIFYPKEAEELSELTTPLEKLDAAKAIIVPHQDLRRCSELYKEAFRHVLPQAKRIIILSPIHGEVLMQDEGHFIFEGNAGSAVTPVGCVEIKSLGLEAREYYAEEEYAPELILPYIARENTERDVYIVYTSIESADESKKLAKLIAKWNDEDTLFIISSNLTGKMKKDEMLSGRDEAASLIVNNEKLMELYRKKKIAICASGIIDAMNRALEGSWHMVGLSDNDESTGHGAFYKEMK